LGGTPSTRRPQVFAPACVRIRSRGIRIGKAGASGDGPETCERGFFAYARASNGSCGFRFGALTLLGEIRWAPSGAWRKCGVTCTLVVPEGGGSAFPCVLLPSLFTAVTDPDKCLIDFEWISSIKAERIVRLHGCGHCMMEKRL